MEPARGAWRGNRRMDIPDRRPNPDAPDPGLSPVAGPRDARPARSLARLDWPNGGRQDIEVWAQGFDTEWQEEGALAAVRDVLEGAGDQAALELALRDILAPDEHGPFHGRVAAPDGDEGGMEVRLRHEWMADGEQ
jgi:hypothetical protein